MDGIKGKTEREGGKKWRRHGGSDRELCWGGVAFKNIGRKPECESGQYRKRMEAKGEERGKIIARASKEL